MQHGSWIWDIEKHINAVPKKGITEKIIRFAALSQANDL